MRIARTLAFVASATLAVAGTIPKRQVVFTPLEDQSADQQAQVTDVSAVAVVPKVFLGVPNSILVADFDGVNFNIVANVSQAGTNPSWMAFREPNLLYAVDEFSNNTRLFVFDRNTNTLQLVQNAIGSSSVVHLEFNKDKTRLVGSSFNQGTIDVWDIADGSLRLMKQIVSNDVLGPNAARQNAPHPHQAVLDPTGRFFVVNDLGTDTLLVIDSQDDGFDVVNRVRVTPDGCGPRHGTFFPRGAALATHYIVGCELLNLVEVFQLTYVDGSIAFVPIQVLSSFGPNLQPLNATTATIGEIVVSSDSRDVYVSNRNTGRDTDSITHFRVSSTADGAFISLDVASEISSGGRVPRMFSFSADEKTLFSTNQDGSLGVLALARTPGQDMLQVVNNAGASVSGVDFSAQVEIAGALVTNPVASISNAVFGAQNAGPQFIMQI